METEPNENEELQVEVELLTSFIYIWMTEDMQVPLSLSLDRR